MLRGNIYDFFNGSKCHSSNHDVFDLADNLAIFLEEEFSVTLEDDSDHQVASSIFKMYEDCHSGNFALARDMVNQANNAMALSSQFPMQLQTSEHEDDEDEDMIIESTTTNCIDTLQPKRNSQEHSKAAFVIDDFIQQPLFGKPVKETNIRSNKPTRQLGEVVVEEKPIEMDEEGFAPVRRKR